MPSPRPIPSAVAVTLLLAAIGCGGGSGPRAGVPDAETAEQQIARLAEQEAEAPPRLVPGLPVPPGVTDSVLGSRPLTDARARLSLDEAVEELALRSSPPPAAPPPLDPPSADQALRHYARGRDAARREQWFLAVTELEKARTLDPTSPVVLRELAHAYAGVKNDARATALFEELLRLEPDNGETLFILGMDAFNRRDFRRAASHLARPRLTGRGLSHDAAAPALADYMLATSLRHLGYDLAWIELGATALGTLERLRVPTIYQPHLDLLYRQRAEGWREIGDALSSLDQHPEALAAYRRSASLPNADPDAIYPRVIHANLAIGRPWSAQAALLDALADDPAARAGDGTAGVVSVRRTGESRIADELRPAQGGERDVRLTGYVARHSERTDLLSRALVERHQARPDDPNVVRAAAVLLPREEAVALLRSFLHRRPADLDVLTQLLGWLIERDERSAVGLTIALIEDNPRYGAEYGDRLARAARSPGGLLRVARSLAPTKARAVVECRLLAYVGAYGLAWQVAAEAAGRWPADRWLTLQQVDIAARLEEPWLLEQLLSGVTDQGDAYTWLVRARARRLLGQTEQAVRDAARAATLDPQSAEAMVGLAAAHVAHAEKLDEPDQRRLHAESAVTSAEAAVALDPAYDDAYAILLALHAPNAMLSDRQRLFELRDMLAESNPHSRLLARLAAQEDLARGRLERALERLLVVCENDPSDVESLELAIAIWGQSGKTAEAVEWLDRRLRLHPADPVLLEQWVAVQMTRDLADRAVERLERLLEAEPEHDDARFLLVTLHRRSERVDLAVPLAEQRLLTRPQAVRRELELAALYAGAERDAAAAERLRWILDHVEEARFDQLAGAIGVAGRMSDRDPAYHELSLELVLRAVDRFPDAPLQVYGTALREMARLGRIDGQFDEMAHRGVRFAAGAAGPTVQDADVWRQLAQALVDAGHPEAAGRAVRARLLADASLDQAAREHLSRVAIMADAAAGRAGDTIELIRGLALRGWLPNLGSPLPAPQLPDVYYEASSVYSMLGFEEGAEQLLLETIRLAPDHAMALNNLGYTRLVRGLADRETEEWIGRAHELAPDDENVLDTVGWLRYLHGRFGGDEAAPGAEQLIREALRRAADPSAEVLDHLGDTLWRLGDAPEAARQWGRAVEILDDASQREQWEQVYLLVQARRWGLLVSDPRDIYQRQFGVVLDRAREKLDALEQDAEPRVAPTFEEQGVTGSTGDDGNGRS